jgi:hypothetical protein
VGHPQIAAIARVANGSSMRPARSIGGEITGLTRGTHDIRYDDVHDEILLTAPQSDALLVFRGGANGAERPIRTIQGDKTRCCSDRLDVDPVHNEIFVPSGRAILVFDREANGNVAPIRVIEGPKTRLAETGGTSTLAVDPVHNILAVGTSTRTPELKKSDAWILFFNRTDSGNVAPIGEIFIPDLPRPAFAGTSYQGMDGGQAITQMQVYPPKGWVIATLPAGDHAWQAEGFHPYIGIWSINDRGTVPPRWKIGGEKTTLLRPRGIVLIPRSKEIVVSDMRQNAIFTYFFPEIF